MKAEFVSKIFFLFICLCAFASAAIAQEKEKPKVLELDEYRSTTEDAEALARRFDGFIERLSQEPATTRGFVFGDASAGVIEQIKSNLSKRSEWKDRIVFDTSESLRTAIRIEFFLVPEGAALPYRCVLPVCVCPLIDVTGKEFAAVADAGGIPFTVKVTGGSQSEVIYKWHLSAGKIVEGQGTKTIKVDAQSSKEITATVEIGGVCDECARTGSAMTKIQ